jgi:hypothetical protein
MDSPKACRESSKPRRFREDHSSATSALQGQRTGRVNICWINNCTHLGRRGHFYSACPSFPGGSRRWEHRVCYQVNTADSQRQRALTYLATSCGQQKSRMKSRLIATAGARSCDLRHANAPLWPHYHWSHSIVTKPKYQQLKSMQCIIHLHIP